MNTNLENSLLDADLSGPPLFVSQSHLARNASASPLSCIGLFSEDITSLTASLGQSKVGPTAPA